MGIIILGIFLLFQFKSIKKLLDTHYDSFFIIFIVCIGFYIIYNEYKSRKADNKAQKEHEERRFNIAKEMSITKGIPLNVAIEQLKESEKSILKDLNINQH